MTVRQRIRALASAEEDRQVADMVDRILDQDPQAVSPEKWAHLYDVALGHIEELVNDLEVANEVIRLQNIEIQHLKERIKNERTSDAGRIHH